MTLHPQWFETFFRGLALDFWQRLMTADWTAAEVAFILEHLDARPGSLLLDAPCGTGRHAIELAKRGYRVTGVDLSDDFLAEAKRAAPGLDWRRADLRSLELKASSYDGAFCWGNSFGYLDYEGAMAFLGSVAGALKPGAALLLDVPTVAESMLPELETSQWYQVDGIYVLTESEYDAEASRVDIHYTFIRDGVIETRPISSYVTTVAELGRMLRACGFEMTDLYRGTDGAAFELGAPGCIIRAVKLR